MDEKYLSYMSEKFSVVSLVYLLMVLLGWTLKISGVLLPKDITSKIKEKIEVFNSFVHDQEYILRLLY